MDATNHFVVTVPIKTNIDKTAIKTLLFYIIGLQKLAHQLTLLLIADQNT